MLAQIESRKAGAIKRRNVGSKIMARSETPSVVSATKAA
jgi:hypothetical protein